MFGGGGGGPLATDECLVVLSKGRHGVASIGWTFVMNKGKLKQKMLGESAACNILISPVACRATKTKG